MNPKLSNRVMAIAQIMVISTTVMIAVVFILSPAKLLSGNADGRSDYLFGAAGILLWVLWCLWIVNFSTVS